MSQTPFRILVALLVGLSVLVSSHGAAPAGQPGRPNIVVIFADDPGEQHDLATANSKKRDELLDQMLAWLKRTDAKLPTERNPKYDPSAKEPKKKGGAPVD